MGVALSRRDALLVTSAACLATCVVLRRWKTAGLHDDESKHVRTDAQMPRREEEDKHQDSSSIASFLQQQRAEQMAWARALAFSASVGDSAELSRLLDGPLPQGPNPSPLDILVDLDVLWPNISAVGSAAVKGHADTLTRLLEARANPDCLCQKVTQWDGAFTLTENDTALCLAAREGHQSCVEVLLALGADPNVKCSSDYFEGDVEWSEEDDGSENMVYSALDAAKMAQRPDMAELIAKRGGQSALQPSAQKRIKITSGSRMGA